jgi:RNA polymerase sigma-70 factor (ECF subfamily)
MMDILSGATPLIVDVRQNGSGPRLEFEDWYRAHHAGLVTLITAVVGNVDEGREAVDDALARAYERWDHVSLMESPTGWTYRVALNVARRRARRRALEVRLLGRSRAESIPGPTGELWLLVAELPARQREAVLLRHVAQMTEREIAEVMAVKREIRGPTHSGTPCVVDPHDEGSLAVSTSRSCHMGYLWQLCARVL